MVLQPVKSFDKPCGSGPASSLTLTGKATLLSKCVSLYKQSLSRANGPVLCNMPGKHKRALIELWIS